MLSKSSIQTSLQTEAAGKLFKALLQFSKVWDSTNDRTKLSQAGMIIHQEFQNPKLTFEDCVDAIVEFERGARGTLHRGKLAGELAARDDFNLTYFLNNISPSSEFSEVLATILVLRPELAPDAIQHIVQQNSGIENLSLAERTLSVFYYLSFSRHSIF